MHEDDVGGRNALFRCIDNIETHWISMTLDGPLSAPCFELIVFGLVCEDGIGGQIACCGGISMDVRRIREVLFLLLMRALRQSLDDRWYYQGFRLFPSETMKLFGANVSV